MFKILEPLIVSAPVDIIWSCLSAPNMMLPWNPNFIEFKAVEKNQKKIIRQYYFKKIILEKENCIKKGNLINGYNLIIHLTLKRLDKICILTAEGDLYYPEQKFLNVIICYLMKKRILRNEFKHLYLILLRLKNYVENINTINKN